MINKRFLIFFFNIVTILVSAQKTSISPYSYLGLGDLAPQDNIISSMGGLNSAYVSEFGNEINFSNPAANHNLSYSVFSVGVNTDFSIQKTSEKGSENQSNTYFSNVSVGFPLTKKIRAGLELRPFTNVGYDILYSSVINDLEQSQYLKGRGGINVVNAIFSYNLTKDFSVGAKIGFNFGNIKKEQELYTSGANLYTGTENKLEYNYFSYLLGVSYYKKLPKNYTLSLGASYGFERNVDTDVDFLQSSYYYNGAQKEGIDTLNYINNALKTKIPMILSGGIMFAKENKWGVGVDLQWINQSKLTIPEDKGDYNNRLRLGAGGWFIPNVLSFRSYFSRATYRYGIFYEDMGMEVNSKKLDQYGITAGIGLPLGKSTRKDISSLNIGFEAGERGTTSKHSLKETYFKINVSLLFNDLWFRKRQFN